MNNLKLIRCVCLQVFGQIFYQVFFIICLGHLLHLVSLYFNSIEYPKCHKKNIWWTSLISFVYSLLYLDWVDKYLFILLLLFINLFLQWNPQRSISLLCIDIFLFFLGLWFKIKERLNCAKKKLLIEKIENLCWNAQ